MFGKFVFFLFAVDSSYKHKVTQAHTKQVKVSHNDDGDEVKRN